MSIMIDVHCHLADKEFDSDRADVIARARDVGITGIIAVGENYDSNLRVLDLAAREPFVRPALGHHPWYLDRAAEDLPKTLALIEEHAQSLVAIGEVGLDYRVAKEEDERAQQRALFTELVEAAKRASLPLSVHVRSAGHYVIDLLDGLGAPPAALHAFDGKAKFVRAGAATGYFFSIPGTVLVSQQKRKLVDALPLENLLLESDAPALSPVRGERNEPAVLARVVEAIAEIKNLTPSEVKRAAERNTHELFGL